MAGNLGARRYHLLDDPRKVGQYSALNFTQAHRHVVQPLSQAPILRLGSSSRLVVLIAGFPPSFRVERFKIFGSAGVDSCGSTGS